MSWQVHAIFQLILPLIGGEKKERQQSNKSLEEVKVLKKCLCFQAIDSIRNQDKMVKAACTYAQTGKKRKLVYAVWEPTGIIPDS